MDINKQIQTKCKEIKDDIDKLFELAIHQGALQETEVDTIAFDAGDIEHFEGYSYTIKNVNLNGEYLKIKWITTACSDYEDSYGMLSFENLSSSEKLNIIDKAFS